MPAATNYDRNTLTPELAARWDWALAEYGRVQEQNLAREVEGMSAADRADYLAKVRHLKLAGAGHRKSALFARLLAGKPALPVPPPTSYSHPWYECIEQKGPWPVSVSVLPPVLAGYLRETGEAPLTDLNISINQCAWAVTSLNESARDLLRMQQHLSAAAHKTEDGIQYHWSRDLLKGVLATYAARPEFIVQHRQWPLYRLRIARSESIALRGYVKDVVEDIAARRHERLITTGSVFDAGRFYLNASMGRPTASATPAAPREQADHIVVTIDDWILEKMPVDGVCVW